MSAAAPRTGTSTTKIAGYDIIFPEGKKPFPAQLAVISRTLAALRGKQNALLESPTGTGKTLALLTSTLSYQAADYAARMAVYEEAVEVYEAALPQQVLSPFSTASMKNSPKATTTILNATLTAVTALTTGNTTPNRNGADADACYSPPPSTGSRLTTPPSSPRSPIATTTPVAIASATIPPICNNNSLSPVADDSANVSALQSGRNKGLMYKKQLAEKRLEKEAGATSNNSCRGGDNAGGILNNKKRSPYKPLSSPPGRRTPRGTHSDAPTTPLAGSSSGPPKPLRPTRRQIFYTSRTHSQLDQVIQELRHCAFEYRDDLSMTVLGSRQHLCINKPTEQGGALDKHCRDLNKTQRGCKFRANNDKVAAKLKAQMVWDIEDAVSNGTQMRGCPYYATRTALADAALVFAPYNYLVDPHIRETMKIDLTDCIVVFDEAHNIQDTCQSAASCEVSYPQFVNITQQLTYVKDVSEALSSLHLLITGLHNWFERTLKLLRTTNGFDNGSNIFDGQEVLSVFDRDCGLNADTVDIFESYIPSMSDEDVSYMLSGAGDQVSAVANLAYEDEEEEVEVEEKKTELGADVVNVIKKILTTFRFVLAHTDAYKLVLKCDDPSDGGGGRGGGRFNNNRRRQQGGSDMDLFYTATFNLWCLSASVAFQKMSTGTHSILLTSGTLSPLESFAGELGAHFPIRVETAHVIDQKKQLLVAAVGDCRGQSLLGTYQAQGNLQYQDALGICVAMTSRCSPGGTLVFFSSYYFMEKVLTRWESTGQWENFMYVAKPDGISNSSSGSSSGEGNTATLLFREPKTARELDTLLEEYRAVIDEGGKAILFAVCRGKVSEGIDFANNYARSVIVVGIPFPAAKDLHVTLKKEYQNKMCGKGSSSSSSGSTSAAAALTGDEWYRQQAYRAINQAVGRCIRHRMDYGSIILCDPRFRKIEVNQNLSKWLRGDVRSFDNFEELILPLRGFFLSQDNYHPTASKKSSTGPSTGAKLTVPLMFASVKKETASSAADTFHPLFGSSCTSSTTPRHTGPPGQLSIGASFTRGVQRVSPLPTNNTSASSSPATATCAPGVCGDGDIECCAGGGDAMETESIINESRSGREIEEGDDDDDAISLASTQDLDTLSPPSDRVPMGDDNNVDRIESSTVQRDLFPASPVNNDNADDKATPSIVGTDVAVTVMPIPPVAFDNMMRDVTHCWKWLFGNRVSCSFLDARSLVLEHHASTKGGCADGGGHVQPDDVITLPIEVNRDITSSNIISECENNEFESYVKQKFFNTPLRSINNSHSSVFCERSGNPVTMYGVRIEEWVCSAVGADPVPVIDSSSSSSSRGGFIDHGLIYTEKWYAEDGVVYGALRLPQCFGGSALAVKVLAAVPHRQMWCGASWGHVDVAHWWYQAICGTNNVDIPNNSSSSSSNGYSTSLFNDTDVVSDGGHSGTRDVNDEGSDDEGGDGKGSKRHKKARVL